MRVLRPAPGHESYEPLLIAIDAPRVQPPPALAVVTFEPVRLHTVRIDAEPRLYGTNVSPRDRMRHAARLEDRPCEVPAYSTITRRRPPVTR